MNKVLVFWVALLLLFSGGSVLWIAAKMRSPRQPDSTPVDNDSHATNDNPTIGHLIPNFTLTERSGETFQSEDLQGEVWIASFFFASCPSTCRQQNELLRGLHERFDARGVKFVSITCDPETDTPERLEEYANLFTKDTEDWLFLTGDLEDIQDVGKDAFHLSVGPQTHSDRFVLIDRMGTTRGIFDWHEVSQLDALNEMIDVLLAEPAPSEGEVNWIKEFTLTERSGKPFHSQEMDGRVWVASFFYSSCPSSCRAQNELIGRLQREFAPQGVTFVNISCDPEWDTPERLREYERSFDAVDDWLFLTGDLDYIRRIGGEKFGVPVAKQAHVDRLLAVDKWGEVRAAVDWHDPLAVEGLKQDLLAMLEETEPPAGDNEPQTAPDSEDAADEDAEAAATDGDAGDNATNEGN